MLNKAQIHYFLLLLLNVPHLDFQAKGCCNIYVKPSFSMTDFCRAQLIVFTLKQTLIFQEKYHNSALIKAERGFHWEFFELGKEYIFQEK